MKARAAQPAPYLEAIQLLHHHMLHLCACHAVTQQATKHIHGHSIRQHFRAAAFSPTRTPQVPALSNTTRGECQRCDSMHGGASDSAVQGVAKPDVAQPLEERPRPANDAACITRAAHARQCLDVTHTQLAAPGIDEEGDELQPQAHAVGVVTVPYQRLRRDL